MFLDSARQILSATVLALRCSKSSGMSHLKVNLETTKLHFISLFKCQHFSETRLTLILQGLF